MTPHGIRTRIPALRSQMPYRYASQLARLCGFEFSCSSGRSGADRSKQHGFLAFTKYLGRIETRIRKQKSTSGGCGQFEISPEAIEPQLRTALCERRQTDRQTDRLKTNYSIDSIGIHCLEDTCR